MPAKFGTDGLRGIANFTLTPELALALGRAAARVLKARQFLIGRDTRLSGPMLQAALAAGMSGEGVEVVDVGVIPTPGLAWLSSSREVPGAMISASHNPYRDNGIKLFAAGGLKLADETEAEIETELDLLVDRAGKGGAGTAGPGSVPPVGPIVVDPSASLAYGEHVAGVLEGRRLDGLRVVLDCACGAAATIAPSVFRRLGASVSVIADEPDGTNINDGCGSTHTERLQREVVGGAADIGLAFDGDADRVLAVDHRGDLVDGDHLLAMFALDLHERGALTGGAVVVTVMTNLGFRIAMNTQGIHVIETKVGDRYVLEALEGSSLALGGEQSGHVIFRQLSTTGDGMLTGLVLLDLVRRKGRALADLAAASMTRLPQELVNVRVPDLAALGSAGRVWDEVQAVEAELGGNGRVLVRASGTEPLVRVMVEATSLSEARSAARRLGEVVEGELGSVPG